MYLSRIILDARNRQARAWLGDCHKLHSLVMSGFPAVDDGPPRARLGVLYRVEPMATPPQVPVLVQSQQEPAWPFGTDAVVRVEGPKPLAGLVSGITAGRRYRFRLRANPTRRVHGRATAGADEARGRKRPEQPEAKGKRVALMRESDQAAWLGRQAQRAGFRLVSVRRLAEWPDTKPDVPALVTAGGGNSTGSRGGARLTFTTVLFEGVLEVTDAQAFAAALKGGIGPGKAFGCGLLSIAPML